MKFNFGKKKDNVVIDASDDSALKPVVDNVLGNNKTSKPKKKISKNEIFSIVSAAILVLAHIAIAVFVAYSFRYYAIYPSLFGCAIGIVICLLIILDIVFFVGFNHKDMALKVITLVLCTFIVAGSTVGVYYVNKVNKTVDNVFYDGQSDLYETINGVFVSNTEHKELTELEGKRIGMLSESTEGVTSTAMEMLDAAGVNYGVASYFSILDMCQALDDEEIDVIAVNAGYKDILTSDENANYSYLIDDVFEFSPFTKEVKVNAMASNKDLSKEPFNVLLIGWSRVALGSTVGLADTIIVASVNPQTYTVNMMSIARDSYVPIPCYNGTKDKVNSGRSTSRACFIETVEGLINEDIDFYMEFDYDAVVAVVDAVEGVKIYNPVEFTLDGVTVPQGEVTAWGWMALQFCRERHAFADGDFARQEHQKEVIMGVVEKLLKEKDINMCIKAMEDAGDKLSTNLTWTQLTTVFNMLLNTKNYTGLKTFDLLDFQNSRITGYSNWYYNYGMSLPLWIYKLYDGSIKENLDHMNFVLGKNIDTSDQKHKMEFSAFDGYKRAPFYHETFDEEKVDEEMPDYYIDLTGMTKDEALAWANEKGVSLTINTIKKGEAGYIEEQDGLVVSQSPRYGSLCSSYPTGTITVMGSGGAYVPSFKGKPYEEAEAWADDNDYHFTVLVGDPTDDDDKVGIIYKQDFDDEEERLTVYVYGETVTVKVTAGANGTVSGSGDYGKGASVTVTAVPNKGYHFVEWSNGSTEKSYTFTANSDISLTATFAEGCGSNDHSYKVINETKADCKTEKDGVKHYKCEYCGDEYDETIKYSHKFGTPTETPATCTTDGSIKKVCETCGKEAKETINNLGHDFSIETGREEATCLEDGYIIYKCSRCDETTTKTINKLGHDFSIETGREEATCSSNGYINYKCSRCDETETTTLNATGNHSWDVGTDSGNGTKIYHCTNTDCTATKEE